jgi:hypothetical protein
VEVFPAGMVTGVDPARRLCPALQPEARFVLDGHLGGLAAILHMLGFDTWWEPFTNDDDLARRSVARVAALLRPGNEAELARDVELLAPR